MRLAPASFASAGKCGRQNIVGCNERDSLRRGDRSGQGPQERCSAIVQLPTSDHAIPVADDADGDASALHDLEAQGFTEDEAVRLIHVSDRLKTSREAREAEVILRRLRFTRWLIQQGMRDEFSA